MHAVPEPKLEIARRRIWVDLLLYPAHTLPTAAAPVLVGVGLAVHDHVFAILPALLAFVGSWLIHVAGVFTDNHELLRRHPAVVEHPELTQALKDGTLTLAQLRLAIAGLLALALPTAVFFWHVGGMAAVVIGLAGVFASLAYAGGPLPYARAGLAECVFFVMFGIVAVAGTYFAQVAWLRSAASLPIPQLDSLPLAAFVVGWPVGALVTNVLLIDDLRDRPFDAVKGWRTIAVRNGVGGSRAAYLSLSLLAYLAPFLFWTVLGFGPGVLLPVLTLPLAWHLGRAIREQETPADLVPMTPRASLLCCLYAALLAFGLAIA